MPPVPGKRKKEWEGETSDSSSSLNEARTTEEKNNLEVANVHNIVVDTDHDGN